MELTEIPEIGELKGIVLRSLIITDDEEMEKTHRRFEDDVMGAPYFGGIRFDAEESHPVENVILQDIIYTGIGGVKKEDIPKEYPRVLDQKKDTRQEVSGNYYPDWSRAAFMDLRNVDNLLLENILLKLIHEDEREKVLLEGCTLLKEAELQFFKRAKTAACRENRKKGRSGMKRSFRRRLIQVVLLSVIGVSSIVILFTTVSYGTTYIKKERQMAETQEEIIKNALEQEMASLYQLGSMMRNDRTLQEYLEAEEDELDGAFINQVSISMINYKKLNPNIKYLTLVRYKDETIRSVGSGWRVDQEVLYKKMCEDFDEAAFTQEETEKLSVSEDIFGEPEHTMNLFFPVYSTYSLYQEIGYISLGIPEKVIREYYEGNSFDNILLTDSEGRILSHKDSSRIGSPYEHDRIVSGNPVYSIGMERITWILLLTPAAGISLLRFLCSVF